MPRAILHRYRDPVDLIWLAVADRIGWRVVRSLEVYASWDGDHTLTVSAADDFDADDSLAQLILHEICHALVEGPVGQRRVDWGLDALSEDDLPREYACHRLQAALADTVGLRRFFGVTTDYRPYYDALPADPLAPGDDPAIALARAAWPAATRGPWSGPIREGLEATAAIAAATRPFAARGDLWALREAEHRLGGALGPRGATCGACAWFHRAGPGTPLDRCRRHRPDGGVAPRVESSERACAAFEAPLTHATCRDCGACCREGFDLVQIGRREPLTRLRPDLITDDGFGLGLTRPGGRCVALDPDAPPWHCTVYAHRPRACREFAIGGDACLEARRRTGLSR